MAVVTWKPAFLRLTSVTRRFFASPSTRRRCCFAKRTLLLPRKLGCFFAAAWVSTFRRPAIDRPRESRRAAQARPKAHQRRISRHRVLGGRRAGLPGGRSEHRGHVPQG